MRLHTSELYIPLPLARRPNDCAIVRSPFLSLSGRYTLNAPAISLLRGRRAREQLELHGRRSAEKEMRSRSAERPGRLRFEDLFFFSFLQVEESLLMSDCLGEVVGRGCVYFLLSYGGYRRGSYRGVRKVSTGQVFTR